MTKQITITISDYVYDTYLNNIESNRSQYIERAIIVAGDIEAGAIENIKSRNIKLVQELREKEEEIKKLKIENGKYKARLSKEPTEEEKANIEKDKKIKQLARGMRASGYLRKLVLSEDEQ